MALAKLIWSDYQKAIFNNVANGKDGEHTVVIARAGASKTTALVESVKYIPKRKSILFLAFNKRIAVELDNRIDKSYVETKTVHSTGLRSIRNALGSKVALDPDKTLNITEAILHEKGYKKFEKEKFNIAFSVVRVVNLCKGALLDTPTKIDALIDQFDIDTFELERDDFIKVVCQVLRKCKENKTVIDYGEMVWFPYVLNLPIMQYDRVFIDELQDLNAAQLHIALSSCKPNGRILGCGDPDQVLYEFTGVDIDGMDTLVKRLNATVLTLPVSYRCPKSVVKLAQEIVPDIQTFSNAKDGSVKFISEKEMLEKVQPGDFILSRVNAPLIYLCLALLRVGTRANIQGRDVGQNLSWMIKKSGAKTVPEFLDWLSEWKKTEMERLAKKNRDPILIIDKSACLEALCEGERSLDSVQDNIKELFRDGDDTTRVILASVHRSKGLERDRVFVLKNTLRRGLNHGEDNVCYVAFTRAKSSLYLVDK